MAVNLEKLLELLKNKTSEYFGDKILDLRITESGEVVMRVDREVIVDVCKLLRDDPDFQFDFLSYVTAIDYLGFQREPRFDTIYQLYSIRKVHRMRVKAAIPEENPSIDSVSGLWRAADWMERECFDMYGILFRNHPDLRRILMPDDWEGHPLRKDFPLGGVKSFYFKRSTEPHAGEPKGYIPRIRTQMSDI